MAAPGPNRGPRGASAVPPLRTLGNHPADNEPVVVMEGRYGAYVKHGSVNATLPDGVTPESVTLTQALALIEARAASAKPTKGKGRAAAPRATAAAKPKAAAAKPKAAAKKPAASKAAAAKPKAPAKPKAAPRTTASADTDMAAARTRKPKTSGA